MLDEREHLAGRQNSVVHGLGGELHVVLAVRVRVPQEVGLVLPYNFLRPVILDLGRRDLRLWSGSFGDGHVPAHVLQRAFEVRQGLLLIHDAPFFGLLDLYLAAVGNAEGGVLGLLVELLSPLFQNAFGPVLVVSGVEIHPHSSKIRARGVGEMLEHVPPSSDGVGLVHSRGCVYLYAEVVTAYGEPFFRGAEGDLLEGRRGLGPQGPAGLVSGHPADVDRADADAAIYLVVSPGQVVDGDGPDQQETHDQGYAHHLAPAGVAPLPALTLRHPSCLVVVPPGGARSTRLAQLFQVVAPPAIPISATDPAGSRWHTGANYRGNCSTLQPLWSKCREITPAWIGTLSQRAPPVHERYQPKGASLGFCERLHYTLPFGSAPRNPTEWKVPCVTDQKVKEQAREDDDRLPSVPFRGAPDRGSADEGGGGAGRGPRAGRQDRAVAHSLVPRFSRSSRSGLLLCPLPLVRGSPSVRKAVPLGLCDARGRSRRPLDGVPAVLQDRRPAGRRPHARGLHGASPARFPGHHADALFFPLGRELRGLRHGASGDQRGDAARGRGGRRPAVRGETDERLAATHALRPGAAQEAPQASAAVRAGPRVHRQARRRGPRGGGLRRAAGPAPTRADPAPAAGAAERGTAGRRRGTGQQPRWRPRSREARRIR